MGVQAVHEHHQAPQVSGMKLCHATPPTTTLHIHNRISFYFHIPLPSPLPLLPVFCFTAPKPGRLRDTDDGRNAVGGGPVLAVAAGAGAQAREGGGLNGSTLIVAPQHVLGTAWYK